MVGCTAAAECKIEGYQMMETKTQRRMSEKTIHFTLPGEENVFWQYPCKEKHDPNNGNRHITLPGQENAEVGL